MPIKFVVKIIPLKFYNINMCVYGGGGANEKILKTVLYDPLPQNRY